MIDVDATELNDFVELEFNLDPDHSAKIPYLKKMYANKASVMITFRTGGKILAIMGISELREESMRHLCTAYTTLMKDHSFEVARVARRTIDEVLENIMCQGLMYAADKESRTAARFSKILGFEPILELGDKIIYRRRK